MLTSAVSRLGSLPSRFPLCAHFVGGVQQERGMGRRAPKQGKPPVLPPSKKVLYHVVHVPWQKPEDVKELLWRRHVYNNAVMSLREVFRAEMASKAAAGLGLDAMRDEEAKELDALLAANEQRNRDRASSREAAHGEEWKKTKLEILTEIEEELEKQRNVAEKATEQVRRSIERSGEFVRRENLEQKILEALERPVVYDYAIDRSGKKMMDPIPVKYQEGTPTRQKSRLYDRTLGGASAMAETQSEVPVEQMPQA